MKNIKYIASLACAALLAACQPKMNVERIPTLIGAPDEAAFTSEYVADSLEWSWEAPADPELVMQVVTYLDGVQIARTEVEPGDLSYRTGAIETQRDYLFVFRLLQKDGTNTVAQSEGVLMPIYRKGATTMQGLKMEQLEVEDHYEMKIVWTKNTTATKIYLTYEETENEVAPKTVELNGDATSYTIPTNVIKGEIWKTSIYAENEDGHSLTVGTEMKVGATRIGFLSVHADPETHIIEADDDEAAAWLWFSETYKDEALFIPFTAISDGTVDLSMYRVLFYIRDIDNGCPDTEVFVYPSEVMDAVPALTEWTKEGGSMVLWQHASTFLETLGRIPTGIFLANDHTIGTGIGGFNPDTWKMGVGATPGDGKFVVDFSGHPLYKGLESQMEPGGFGGKAKLLPVKGAAWTEDHNCCFFNWPGQLTGLGNQDPQIYNRVVEDWGIVPLGCWDGQMNWIGQLIVWEARPGKMDQTFQGSFLCISNGGLEFAYNNPDGSPNIERKINPYQKTVETIAKNAVEYLRTR